MSSTGIVVVAAIFLGGVLGYQMYVSLHYFNAESLLGGSVGVTVFRELGPMFTAIMVTRLLVVLWLKRTKPQTLTV